MDWMVREVTAGFQRLQCLGLNFQPSPDLIQGTVMAWIDALNHNRVWNEELDTPRFQQAFKAISASSSNWPKPVEFVAALPPRPELVKLEAPKADPQRVDAKIQDLLNNWEKGNDK